MNDRIVHLLLTLCATCVFTMIAGIAQGQTSPASSSTVTFNAIDDYGLTVECKVSFFNEAGKDLIAQFHGLRGTQIPYGTYTYGLKCLGGATNPVLTQGIASVSTAEVLVVVPVRRSPIAGVAVDGAAPRRFVMRGRIEPMPTSSMERHMWIRLSPVYQKGSLDISVDPTGEFRIYTPLIGLYLLTVICDDGILDVQQISFENGLPLKSFTVKLPPDRPSVLHAPMR
jgi:hypothetical protein